MLDQCLADPAPAVVLRRALFRIWLLRDAAAARIARVKWSRALTTVATYTITRGHMQLYFSIDQER